MQIRKNKILIYILTIIIFSLFLISNSLSIQLKSNPTEPHFSPFPKLNSPSNEINTIYNYMLPTLNKKIKQQNLQITIYNPFGLSIINTSKTEKQKDTKNPLTTVIITFKDITQNTYSQPKENFCLIGGWYSYNIKSNPAQGGFFSSINPLFYCYTIKDLISNIKIPILWKNDTLLLYCNDGNKINYITHNFAIFQINDYKTCILKNLQKNETVIYGLDSGNTILDDINSIYYNTTEHKGSILNSKFKYNESGTKKLNKKDETIFNYYNKQYYFIYKKDFANMFILTNQNLNLTYSITKIFSNTSKIGLSRVALFKSFLGKYQIYGYEKPTFLLTKNSKGTSLPTYIISTNSNFPIPKYVCNNMLASYNPKDISSFKPSTKIVCGKNQIWINSFAIDSSNYGYEEQGGGILGTVNSFKLFENIIFQITK